MFNKIKEYLDYRRNSKIAKRELVHMAATALPIIRQSIDKKANILQFIINLADGTKNMNGDKLVETVLSQVSNALQTSNGRLIDIFTYIASLEPKDIQKILVYGAVESNKNVEK